MVQRPWKQCIDRRKRSIQRAHHVAYPSRQLGGARQLTDSHCGHDGPSEGQCDHRERIEESFRRDLFQGCGGV